MKRLITLIVCFCLGGFTTQAEVNPQPKGYTIPTLDLSKQTHRQIVVDREKGQYLGHPTTVLLEDNKTMLIVYPKAR